jgi:hypothetical protein
MITDTDTNNQSEVECLEDKIMDYVIRVVREMAIIEYNNMKSAK